MIPPSFSSGGQGPGASGHHGLAGNILPDDRLIEGTQGGQDALLKNRLKSLDRVPQVGVLGEGEVLLLGSELHELQPQMPDERLEMLVGNHRDPVAALAQGQPYPDKGVDIAGAANGDEEDVQKRSFNSWKCLTGAISLGLLRGMGVVGAAMRVVTAGGRFPAFLAMAPLSFQRASSFPCSRRHAETNFFVLSAGRRITKESSFPDPLAHPPREGQNRWWKVRTIINIIEIPRPADSQPARYPDGSELDADPANTPRRHDLAVLNLWRNVAAHQGTTLPPAAH